jgi:two-component system chemotaxis sensor kinase CheA
MSDIITKESFQEFYSECDEIVSRVAQHLNSMDSHKENSSLIDSLYRDIHTIKGSAQLFNLSEIAQITHVMEAALEPARRKTIPLETDWVDCLFACLDLIDKLIKAEREPKQHPKVDLRTIQLTVSRLIDSATRHFGSDLFILRDPHIALEHTGQQLMTEPATNQKSSSGPTEDTPENRASDSSSLQSFHKDEAPTATQESLSTIRVQVSLLDRLMNLVGEMVLVRNQVIQYSQNHEDFLLINLSQKLDLVTSELQEEVMQTRMQPIGSILSKLNRFVRDLARDLSKQIDLSIEGAETELDKTLIEAIKDPLTHIIRNACDHGIEDPETRRAISKSPQGRISISSQQESGQVVIEIMDDGRGLDSKKILEKAIERKLISQETSTQLTEREINELIFTPGFSTAKKVSAVSGRGVGMDVVKTNIEKIGGTVDLKSEPNQGTCIRLKIPLTLAIVPALIARYHGNRFAIPQIKLLELVRVDSSENHHKLEFLQGKPVFRLRGNLLPLVSLDEIIVKKSTNPSTTQLGPSSKEKLGGQSENNVNIIVLATDSGPFGLIVDEILDTADIVVKPLANFFKKLMIYSGATIMGDGSVSLILDILGIAAKSNLNQSRTRKLELGGMDSHRGASPLFQPQEMLSFSLNIPGNFTIPLCLVQRLEEFPETEIEISGQHRIVQYRNAVLPLIDLNQVFDFQLTETKESTPENSESNKVPVIVIQKRNRLYGVVVNRIIDILVTDHEIEEAIQETPGILGNMIIGQEVSVVVDILRVVDLVTGPGETKRGHPSKEVLQKSGHPTQLRPLKILFAEDTLFFVKQVTKILTSQGHQVTHAIDGEEALKILESSRPGDFDLIISDIEMPKMNGFQLAQKIKANSEFSDIPMIALTTRMREADIEQGKLVGFTQYLEKLKSDQLIQAIQEVSHERTATQ